jgi:hypothetical protein
MSLFTGWSAHDIVGSLNKSEVRRALLDYDLEKGCFRTWDSIERMLLFASDEIKGAIHRSAIVKGKIEEEHRNAVLKRDREYKKMVRNVRR